MNWFISEFNSLAYRFIKDYQPAKAPAVTLIYGPRGVGKSTLLADLYHREMNRGALLTDALLFARQYAFAAQADQLQQFRKRHRSLGLLLLDDLQLIAGKVRTIEELHYTYEHLIDNGGKLVVTVEGERPGLDFLSPGLASRLSGGAVLAIKPPHDYEIKRFLENYTHEIRLIIDNSVLKTLSERVGNLADARLQIRKFLQFAERQEDELSSACFQSYWEDEENKRYEAADPVNILSYVSRVMGISAEEIVGLSRKAKVSAAREMAIFSIRTLCNLSYPVIGQYFNRNHNTIMLACQRMAVKLSRDQNLNSTYNSLLKAFKTREP